MIPEEKEAKELIDDMYSCMPFRDLKLTSCDENPELIQRMELLSAKQCALIFVDFIIGHINSNEFEIPNKRLEFWLRVKLAIEKFND